MTNRFIPWPRFENAIFVGDTATEALAALKIHARGLIGGDVPAFEKLHPAEKMIECVACAMGDRKGVLEAAARRLSADYILLEDNGRTELNPATMQDALARAGFSVKVLDIQGTVAEVLRRAGALFGVERDAERTIEAYEERLTFAESLPKTDEKVLATLSVRHPLRPQTWTAVLTRNDPLTSEVIERLGAQNIVPASAGEIIPGALGVESLGVMLHNHPDTTVIALTGDAASGMSSLRRELSKDAALRDIPAIRNLRIFSLPYWSPAEITRLPEVLEIWHEALAR